MSSTDVGVVWAPDLQKMDLFIKLDGCPMVSPPLSAIQGKDLQQYFASEFSYKCFFLTLDLFYSKHRNVENIIY